MARLSYQERLARDICWGEFINPISKTLGITKAQYWAKMPQGSKDTYLQEADVVIRTVRSLGRVRIDELMEDIEHDLEFRR
jgi:hypothetical protein